MLYRRFVSTHFPSFRGPAFRHHPIPHVSPLSTSHLLPSAAAVAALERAHHSLNPQSRPASAPSLALFKGNVRHCAGNDCTVEGAAAISTQNQDRDVPCLFGSLVPPWFSAVLVREAGLVFAEMDRWTGRKIAGSAAGGLDYGDRRATF